ncbi:DUF6356 family protein [uncultured Lentibacter sp.]|uniref:DUF6356 family protein n=1 Tax=uncultured Lentibacter sp. TaxID=1659309 RepID=UPI002602C2C9|nr:DUF6356 family protein [uncultured Lentibacter sp.]
MINKLFLSHPNSVNESYFEHMRFALGFSMWLSVAGLAALVHAFMPALCEKTASRILVKLYGKTQNRGR